MNRHYWLRVRGMRRGENWENVNAEKHQKSRQDKELSETLRAQLRFNNYICTDAHHNFLQQYTTAWEKQNREAKRRIRNRYGGWSELNKDKWEPRALVITPRQPNLRSNLEIRGEAKGPLYSTSFPVGKKKTVTGIGSKCRGEIRLC